MCIPNKMFVGVVRDLGGVEHVLDHKKKLVSLGVLDDFGLLLFIKGWSQEDCQRCLGGNEETKGRQAIQTGWEQSCRWSSSHQMTQNYGIWNLVILVSLVC